VATTQVLKLSKAPDSSLTLCQSPNSQLHIYIYIWMGSVRCRSCRGQKRPERGEGGLTHDTFCVSRVPTPQNGKPKCQ
jgi:hypothetical protein